MESVRGGRGAFLGTPGAMVELPVVSAQQSSMDRDVTFKTTLGGGRRAFASLSTLRTWTVSLPGQRPAELSALLSTLRTAPGPYVWQSPYAQVTNILSPQQTSGAVCPADSYVVRASGTGMLAPANVYKPRTAGAASAVAGGIPVVPGLPFTAGATVWGDPDTLVADVYFQDAQGVYLDAEKRDSEYLDGAVHVSGVVPAGAATAQLYLTGHSMALYPTFTYTTSWLGASEGFGCPAAVVDSISFDTVATHAFLGGVRTQRSSMRIVEVA